MSTTMEPLASDTGRPAPMAGGHGFFNQVHIAGAGALGGFADGAALDLGGAAGHANDDARAGFEHAARVHHLDELLDHLLGDDEVGNHAVLHGADGFDIAGHLAQHGLGFLANGLDGFLALGAAFVANGDHRGLIENDALVAYKNQGVGRTKSMARSVEKYRRKDPNIKYPLGHGKRFGPRHHGFIVEKS
jgi:hypothetical protein